MKKLTKTMKTMLDALAFADAGEYLTDIEKTRTLNKVSNTSKGIYRSPAKLNNEVKAGAEQDVKSRSRRVALYMGNELPLELMEYVVDTCERLQHELVILTFESKRASEKLLKPYQQLLDEAGVKLHMVNLTGDPLIELKHYLGKHPEIAFLACKDSGYLARLYLNGLQKAHSLPVPVVVVATSDENGEKVQIPEHYETDNLKVMTS